MILTCFLVIVIFLTAKSKAQRESVCPKAEGYIDCYICTSAGDSEDNFCGDPFNISSKHPHLTVKLCHGYCTKWITDTLSGSLRTTRMCSADLKMNMQKATVCMHERRSANGQLCFCDEDLCNSGRRYSKHLLIIIVSLFLNI